jgi:mono/diheme cytochrome c family protein
MRLALCLAAALLPVTTRAATVDFTRQVQPILSENCYACHGPDAASVQGGLRLDRRDAALAGGESGKAIVPGDPDASLLLERVSHADPDTVMPPPDKKPRLTPDQVAILRRWIAEGAAWGDHWAFVSPKRPPVPDVSRKGWVRNPIDAFVMARLEAEGLEPSPPADDATLLRRLALDLTGLPPTLTDLASIDSPDAQADRLIASPHFGERWGREWLDAARYSDSAGYEKDLPRYHHFYRDWVVGAMNANMPYDQFVVRQIAGDLLPGATQDDRIATGFLRNSMTNEEGGAKPEQFRIEGIFDRIDAIGKAVLGLTAQCAQCHSHKYDPLTQEEYFGLYAYLNGVEETSLAARTRTEEAAAKAILTGIAAIDDAIRSSSPDAERAFAAWQSDMLALPRTAWHVITLEQLGDSGQKYVSLPDASIINMGYADTRSAEGFKGAISLPEIRAARLEILNDPYLPMNGPGRSTRGTGTLSEFVLRAGPSLDKLEKLAFRSAAASVNAPPKKLDPMRFPSTPAREPDDRTIGPAAFAIDGDEKTGWTTELDPARNHDPAVIVFELEEPLQSSGTTHFRYVLVQRHGGFNSDDNQTFNLGRIRLSVAATAPNALDQLPPLVAEALFEDPARRTPDQRRRLFSHWRADVPEFAVQSAAIESVYSMVPEPTWAIVAAETARPRETRFFERGEQTHPKHVVQPHVPAFLHPLPDGDPKSRLTFARWLVARDSPVAARVFVNRVWQAYFGTGLLETSEDFGHQAAAPSHPDLLDWLACEFMQTGWDMKRLHRLIVTSATYRQSSVAPSELRQRDPKNRLLARGPRFRVPAETVRDIQLASAGLLDPRLGGRSVFPPAPRYLFERPMSYGPKTWFVETDSNRYRRALYTFRFRSVPYPMLATFDAPSGSVACVRRTVSTTPLQALVTLNEQVSLEAAVGLAHVMLRDPGTPRDAIARAFERCTSRRPTSPELDVLVNLYETRRADVGTEATDFLEAYRPVTLDLSGHRPADLAAAAAVARVVLNLDETIVKN